MLLIMTGAHGAIGVHNTDDEENFELQGRLATMDLPFIGAFSSVPTGSYDHNKSRSQVVEKHT